MIDESDSPAVRIAMEAVDMVVDEGSWPYPGRTSFVNDETPSTAEEIEAAFDRGYSVVLVSADGTTSVLEQEAAAG